MLDLKFIRDHPAVVKKAIKDKGIKLNLDDLLKQDQEVVALKTKLQGFLEQRNSLSQAVAKAAQNQKDDFIAQSKKVGEQAKAVDEQLHAAEEKLRALMLLLPGIPSQDTPIGASDKENVVVKTWGKKPSFDFEALDHYDLLEQNDWADFKKIAHVSGSRSYVLKNDLVRLELAIHLYVADKVRQQGFTLLSVPALAKGFAFEGMGQFPLHKEETYQVEDDLYLAGTSEVLLNSLHAGEVLSEHDLPLCYAGFSACFRREAGSAGKDVRGLVRVHQFLKTEQYVLCIHDPQESDKWYQTLLHSTESTLQDFDLPYQVIACCTGDMGQGKYRMNDIEAWVPSQNKYREICSCSTLHDWQARRTNLRYREHATGVVKYVHTLNSTGIATPRILVSLLENHQQKDGSVLLPKVLHPYMGGLKRLKKA